MHSDAVDAARASIIGSIHDLMEIGQFADEGRLMYRLKVQEDLLVRLDERIERSQLPERFVRSVINDIRLDVLIVFADIKLFLTLMKQEAAAPTVKLKQQARDRLSEYKGEAPSNGGSAPAQENDLAMIQSMLERLKRIEPTLNESIL